jgi:signal transduction histidine kinase
MEFSTVASPGRFDALIAEAETSERKLLHERAARAEAEAEMQRAAFLAEASRVLASSLDHETTLARVARLAVPFLADYCLIDVVDDDGLRRIATAHGDPARELLVRQLERYTPSLDASGDPVVRALREARSIVLDAGPQSTLSNPRDTHHRALLRQLRPRRAAFVPILTGTDAIGVISLFSADRDRTFGADDLALAEDLARRTAAAVVHARCFRQAQEAIRARDDILAVVAHDLRNPLSAVLNGTELLLELDGDETRRHFLEVVHHSAESMNVLITDLLGVARLEHGQIPLDITPRRADVLLRDAVAMLEPLANARGIELTLMPVDRALRVLADHRRILQVFSNLIGNAIKFTPEGGRVRIRCAEEGEHTVRFEVADTGCGIVPEDMPHIFGQFWQGRPSDRRGMGLGLAIAKGVVEAHGGRIWAESEPGAGATFLFTIPRATQPVHASAGAAPAAEVLYASDTPLIGQGG